MATPSPALLDRFAAIVGAAHVLREAADIAPRLVENRGLYHGASPLVLKPGSVEEVSAILKLASETGTAIVPQTGNTGLVGGQTPRDNGADVIVSLERMNRIREVDAFAGIMVVDGGCILADVQKAAEDCGRLFRCRWVRKAHAGSAAISPPMPAARRCLPMATCASSA